MAVADTRRIIMEQCEYCGHYTPSGCGRHYCAEELQEDIEIFVKNVNCIFPEMDVSELTVNELTQMADAKSEAQICHCGARLKIQGTELLRHCTNCRKWIDF